MKGALYSGLSKLRIKGVDSNTDGDVLPFMVFTKTPARVCSLYLPVHSKLFTSYCGWCNKVSHSSSDLKPLGIRNYPCERAFTNLDPLST